MVEIHAICISCIVKDEWISEVSFGMFYILKRLNVLQFFFFNSVERKVCFLTNKQDFLTLLHFRSFSQFQKLPDDTWNCVAENLIALCFLAFLNNTNKKCFILLRIFFRLQ